GLAATSYRFRAGWVATDNPDVPDPLDVAVDRATHRPGETARVHVAAPFDGQATLLVLTGRVHLLRNVTVSAKGTDLDVPVGADWGPGAYVVVHAYRPAAAGARAERAIGLAWIGIDPAGRTIAARIDVPDKLPPRAQAVVPVHTDPGAWVTLAAVDEGILRLTSFVSPDPAPHFLGRRRLGIDIRDDWGRLIAPATGDATVLQQGGDAGYALPDIPIRTVSLFAGPVRAGPDGVARIPIDLPDFAGRVRLMAVTWQGARIGSASADVLVRDPLVAEPLLPRFLAPGDEARLTVLLHNLDLPAGAATVDVSTEGPLAVAGPAHLSADLAPGAQATPIALLRATGAGRAVMRLAVHGPGGFAVTRTTALTVRPSRPPVSVVTVTEVPAGGQVALDPAAGRFVADTWSATASYGGVTRYDVAGLVRALADYPLLCLEQATSKGMGLVFLPDGPLAGPDRAGQIQRAASRVLDLQRYDGG
ncbi:alpha-2-macroglobulin family protein, partial [Acidisphaera rubrifaciens]|uniref:alpha-2-macroglobulin family protein n=1 Tax=Acidisphaera rubrifaciens TaxID=50715 RepID=UPI0006629F4C